MPKHSYGPDDPEIATTVNRTGDGDFFAPPGSALPSRCKCGAPAVMMRAARPRPMAPTGVVPLTGFCEKCGAADAEAEKREILAGHAKRRKVLLERLNREMIDLYRDREVRDPETAWVTVVDARRRYRLLPDTDPNADLRFLGSLFRSRGWSRVPGKQEKNCDEGNHARPVDCWVYVGGKS